MKNLLVSAIVLQIFMMNSAMSAEEVDVSKKPIGVPTLDYLHNSDEGYPASAYTISKVGEGEAYDFVNLVADADGNLTKEYYKISLNEFSSDYVTFEDVTDTISDGTDITGQQIVAVTLPSGTKYFEYSLKDGVFSQSRTEDLMPENVDGTVFAGLSSPGNGGAIYNSNKENSNVNIKADFIGNSVQGSKSASGGAINNHVGTIGAITGDFIGNYVKAGNTFVNSSAEGGAIYNYASSGTASIGAITGDFIGNYAKAGDSFAKGGAIYNEAYGSNGTASIGAITGDFIGNSARGQKGGAYGGAIYNEASTSGAKASIGAITGDFIGNYAKSENNGVYGGAIYNDVGTIGAITGDFIGNYAKSENNGVYGGAIFNSAGGYKAVGNTASIGAIKGDFIGNSVQSHNSKAYGGAIYNYVSAPRATASIGAITGDFIGNSAKTENTEALGGAIYNDGYYGTASIGVITGDFIGNSAVSENGVAKGGAIYNQASSNDGKASVGDIINASFKNNYVSGVNGTIGGAIYSTEDISIVAKDGGVSEFSGNYALVKGVDGAEDVRTPNAIYMDAQDATLTLKVGDGSQIIFNDEIDGKEGYKIDIAQAGDEETLPQVMSVRGNNAGRVDFNSQIHNADIVVNGANVNLAQATSLSDNNNLTINSGVFNVAKIGAEEQFSVNSLTINGGEFKVSEVEVDLAQEKMGSVFAENYLNNGGKVSLDKMLLISEANDLNTKIPFELGTIKDDVERQFTTVQQAVAPVYKYDVAFNKETGEFEFVRAGAVDVPAEPEEPNTPEPNPEPEPAPNPNPDWFNPAVFANDVFQRMSVSAQEDIVKRVFDEAFNEDTMRARVWAKPFYSDDTVSHDGFYDVDSRKYGVIAGVDSKAYGDNDARFGYTVFGAFSDNKAEYEGLELKGRSWLVGLKASVVSQAGYYGDAVVDYAHHDMRVDTAHGKDSNDAEGYGAALKAGYKQTFGKFGLDTSAMLDWQTIMGEDYTSVSTAEMTTDDYSRLTLTPQIKLSYEFNKHLDPYLLARYNIVLDEDGSSKANNIALPKFDSKDYVEYGFGVALHDVVVNDGFVQLLRRDGGREGFEVTAGFRYKF